MKDQSWKEKVERKQKHKNPTVETQRSKSAAKSICEHLCVCVDNNSREVAGCMGEAVNKGTAETSSRQWAATRCLTDRRDTEC